MNAKLEANGKSQSAKAKDCLSGIDHNPPQLVDLSGSTNPVGASLDRLDEISPPLIS